MEVKVGVQFATRELVLETDASQEDVERAVTDALAGDDGLLALTDERGRRVVVPARTLAYVEMGPNTQRKVGFA